ncbi:hypothetical protein FRB90_000629 [Tulasnella sp. 427]|nr:hypothetical protein FRB90_000629 [Tulasnella sp. 427]
MTPVSRQLFGFRNVCKRWAEVIDGTPGLWTLLRLDYDPNLMSLILKNSKYLPLSVSYSDTRGLGFGIKPTPLENITAFLSIAVPSCHRWSSLVYGAPCASDHTQILGLPLHNLSFLNILMDGNIKYTPALDAPELQDVHVHRCSLNWKTITGLRSLKIDQNTEGPTVEEIQRVLITSPDLEELSVSRNWPDSGSVKDRLPILLPNLRSIWLYKITAPNLENFYFHFTEKYSRQDFNPILQAGGRHIGVFGGSNPEDLSELSVSIKPWLLQISIGERVMELQSFPWEDGSPPCGRNAPNSALHAVDINDVAGCAIGIVDKANPHDLKPEDFAIFSTKHQCPWYNVNEFQVPENMPACSQGVGHCAWFWIHSPNSGSMQMYMNEERLDYTSTCFATFGQDFCKAMKSVTLRGYGDGEAANYCQLINEFFPMVESLAVTGKRSGYPDIMAVMDAINIPRPAKKGGSFLFLRLKAVRFKADPSLKSADIVAMVEARSASDQVTLITSVTLEEGEIINAHSDLDRIRTRKQVPEGASTTFYPLPSTKTGNA